MDSTILAELINNIKNLSPMVWEILMKQVYANIISQIFWGLVMGIGAPIFLIRFIPYARKMHEKDKYSTWDMSETFAWIFGILVTLAGFMILTYALQGIYNPEYYAIQSLLSNIP